MQRRFFLWGVWLVLASLSAAQSPAPLPDELLYRALFQRVAWQKDFADHIAAQGQNDAAARVVLRLQMQLSYDEYKALEAIAVDHVARTTAYFKARASANARGSALDAAQSAMTQAHVNQLRQQLGDARFQALDAWARSEILPHVKYFPLKGAN